ncbi:efflux RND transporter periplasmic adaptor subunit [Granulosicoccus sp. 3-233]|uniref:efflux RND transporter periplasmic adaptor subunit n=1 Tax=Granulosicoccus sp. 3-233 TaxID=3417969 RepID=UPI003D357D92
MKKSWLAAGTLVIVLSLWMATGLLQSEDSSVADETKPDPLMTVEIETVELQEMARKISLQGELEPARYLQVKAETSGRVEQLLVRKGVQVSSGDALVQLDPGSRLNTLAEASARVKSARSEQEAAETLRRQRLQSKVQTEQAEAALESALAQLHNIELDISRTTIAAPFDALVNDLPVERGELIERGDVIAELVDNSAFDVTAQAAQQAVSSLLIGQDVSVDLITGESLPGKLTYISSIADPQTRSFRVEARVENPKAALAAGISATLTIPVEQIEAAFITPSALSLGDDGELGIKAVDADNRVYFLPIELVSTSLDGAWVSGIPAQTRIITLGQGFVALGEEVQTRLAQAQDQPAASDTN